MADIKPIRKIGAQCDYIFEADYDDVVEAIGFPPNVTDLDDEDKVKASWGFTVDGEECGVWCYRVYSPYTCRHWSWFGSQEAFDKVFTPS